MFSIPPQKIMYCYGEYQPMFDRMLKEIPNLVLHHGLPSKDEINTFSEDQSHTVLILDDLFRHVIKSADALDLFCVTAHHKCVSVIFLTQNIFGQGPFARSISLNCMYVVLFKNVRDGRQIMTFGSQVYPKKTDYFMDAYNKATKMPYGYLLCDLSPQTPDQYRLRSNILQHQYTSLYTPQV